MSQKEQQKRSDKVDNFLQQIKQGPCYFCTIRHGKLQSSLEKVVVDPIPDELKNIKNKKKKVLSFK